MEDVADKKITHYPVLTEDEAKNVMGYAPQLEQMRQHLASNGNFEFDDEDHKLNILSIEHYILRHAQNIANRICDNYTGGNWVISEHGLPNLEDDINKVFNVSGSYRDHSLKTEEFSLAVAIYVTTDLCNYFYENNDLFCEFFSYLRHFAFCTLNNVTDPEILNTSEILKAVD